MQKPWARFSVGCVAVLALGCPQDFRSAPMESVVAGGDDTAVEATMSVDTASPDTGGLSLPEDAATEPDTGSAGTDVAEIQWYKAQFHAHSPNSFDFKDAIELEDVVAAHRAAGFHVVAYSDHGVLTDASPYETADFLTIPNVEIAGDSYHMNALFATGIPSLAPGLEGGLTSIRDSGALPIVNHPGWASPEVLTSEQLVDSDASQALFIDILWSKIEDTTSWIDIWDGTLSAGRQVYGLGMDDSHALEQIGRSYTYVGAQALDRDSVRAALLAGALVVSNGVVPLEVDWDGAALHAAFENAVRIDFFGAGRVLLGSVDGSVADFTPENDQVFVRAEAYDEFGKVALTQAFFL